MLHHFIFSRMFFAFKQGGSSILDSITNYYCKLCLFLCGFVAVVVLASKALFQRNAGTPAVRMVRDFFQTEDVCISQVL